MSNEYDFEHKERREEKGSLLAYIYIREFTCLLVKEVPDWKEFIRSYLSIRRKVSSL